LGLPASPLPPRPPLPPARPAPPPAPIPLPAAPPTFRIEQPGTAARRTVDQARQVALLAAGADRIDRLMVERLRPFGGRVEIECEDRKSTRLNSSHVKISYAVFCLKKKKCRRGTRGRS